MRDLVLTIVLTLAAHSATADPVLIGTWRSDHDLTMNYAKKHANLEPKTFHFLGQLMGRLTLTFTPDRVTNQMPDWEFESAEGIKSRIVGFAADMSYKLLASSPSQTALVWVEPVSGEQTITVYHFENDDTMWMYLGGQPFSDLNAREYFVRVK